MADVRPTHIANCRIALKAGILAGLSSTHRVRRAECRGVAGGAGREFQTPRDRDFTRRRLGADSRSQPGCRITALLNVPYLCLLGTVDGDAANESGRPTGVRKSSGSTWYTEDHWRHRDDSFQRPSGAHGLLGAVAPLPAAARQRCVAPSSSSSACDADFNDRESQAVWGGPVLTTYSGPESRVTQTAAQVATERR